jgi:protein arginine kinase
VELREHLDRPTSGWSRGTGPDADVVVSSRVRLARNIANIRFPSRQSPEEATEVLTLAERAVGILGDDWDFYRLAPLTAPDRRVLVEKHLISPQLARQPQAAAVAMSHDERSSLMVNEEDHLRLQVMEPGRNLPQAWQEASAMDDRLEADLEYAFEPDLGYLTACPTNLGTGMRASAMVHLPVLVMSGRVGALLQAVTKIGYAVRGMYGEGTDAVGNLFQVSNQRTLGMSEEEIVAHLDQVLGQVIQAERESRHELRNQSPDHLADRVGRAYGILRGARLLTTAEAMRLISDIRLGIALGMLPEIDYAAVNALLVICRSGYLARVAGRELPAAERDVLRARLVREHLQRAEAAAGGR